MVLIKSRSEKSGVCLSSDFEEVLKTQKQISRNNLARIIKNGISTLEIWLKVNQGRTFQFLLHFFIYYLKTAQFGTYMLSSLLTLRV